MEERLLATKKPLHQKTVNSEDVFLVWKREEDTIHFFVAEMIDKKCGLYKILRTGERALLDIKERYNADELRDDNLVYSKMYVFETHFAHHEFYLKDLFHYVNDEKDGVMVSVNLNFAEFGKERDGAMFFYSDPLDLIHSTSATKQDWLKFEDDINKIWQRSVYLGKNYLSTDEEKVEKAVAKHKLEHQKMLKQAGFNLTHHEGDVEYSLYK